MPAPFSSRPVPLLLIAVLLGATGCDRLQPRAPQRTPQETRAQLLRLLPATLHDRNGWAADIQSAFQSLELPPSDANLCAALAVIEQESGYKADPPVPGLGRIARSEIERRAARLGVPKFAVAAALLLEAPDGQSYGDKLAAVRTERELSELFEAIVARTPALGRSLLERANPVRTGGPMQVGIAFAQGWTQVKPYPYPIDGSLRREVFSRRGGLYFGIAHLLKYPNSYQRHLYRFADFNAGHYASRNAAFQAAVSVASGIPLTRDGDLLAADGRGTTEQAVLTLAPAMGMTPEAVRRDLRDGRRHRFEMTTLYGQVFELARQRNGGKPLPRAVLPQITLESPKITRTLTTAWFAQKVEQRYRACEARAAR